MVVRNEAAIIERCLRSVLPLVDSWVIFDTGSIDGTADIAERCLSRLPGELRRVPFQGFANLRNDLLAETRAYAPRTLMIDADEVLHCPGGKLPDTRRVGLLETGPADFSLFPARLIPDDTPSRFAGSVGERLEIEEDGIDAEPLEGLRIWHFEDGCRWRDPGMPARDAAFIEADLLGGAGGIMPRIALAQALLRAGNIRRARELLEALAAQDRGDARGWYCRYLYALVLDRDGADRQQVIDQLVLAHESRPDKLESLARLSASCRVTGELDKAAALGRLGLELKRPDQTFYFEPPLHRYGFRLRHAEVCLALSLRDEARETLAALEHDATLPRTARNEVDKLNASISGSTPVETLSVGRKAGGPEGADATRAPRLTIGMATFDDFDGVFFTVNALRAYHPAVDARSVEILVVDNNPDGPCSTALTQLARNTPGCRYVACGDVRGTAVRDRVFREARGEIVLCVDSHVLVAGGGVDALLAHFDSHPHSRDLIQGPLLWDDHRSVSTHMDPRWNAGFFGVWGGREHETEPFEIPMQGLGLFACRRDAWPGFNPRFRGFGGEEGYIHEKFRRAGGRCICLPALKWQHRFQRPLGTRYAVKWEDRIRNYMIGFDELKLDVSAVENHFVDFLTAPKALPAIMKTRAELDNPFHFFDAIYCINLDDQVNRWQAMCDRFDRLGIAERVVRYPAIKTPDDHHVGCTLSHRAIVEMAAARGWENVLVFEDDAVFRPDALLHLRGSVEELRSIEWRVLYLGGHRWGRQPSIVQGCQHVGHAGRMTCTHAVAYHKRGFQALLDGIPGDETKLRELRRQNFAIDQFLVGAIPDRFVTLPVVSSQGSILRQEDPEARLLFT